MSDPSNPAYGSLDFGLDWRPRATCPECYRTGLVLLQPDLIVPRHKTPSGRWCGGSGRAYAEFGQPGKGAAEGAIA